MKRILLFSRDPGGANAIIPLVESLKSRGYQVRLFGKDMALNKYLKADLMGVDIMDHIRNINLENITYLLSAEKPDFIITGTSADDFTERYIWKSAEILSIPSFAIIDQWINYGVRFSKYDVSRMNMYEQDKLFPYLPSKIFVMDEIAKREAIKEGLDESRIIVSGQPYFDFLIGKAGTVSEKRINEIRHKCGISRNRLLITFVSEPISDTYKEKDESRHYWGYTEKTIFKIFLNCMENIIDSGDNKITIMIRLHPKEKENKYADTINNFKHKKINIITDRCLETYELILSSDFVCGMSSILLIETVVLNKPVISIQVGLCRENPFILDRIGIIKSITDTEELYRRLHSMITQRNQFASKFSIVENATENIIGCLEKYICQN